MADREIPQVGDHGGSLARAAALFAHAPLPWIDCSTGISPHAYPVSPLPASVWQRLPEPEDERRLRESAARAYGAPGPDNVVAAPGTQILLPRVAALARQGRALVLGPTYAEHARCAALAGHEVTEAGEVEALVEADLAVVVNPNNPDGRLLSPETLLVLARRLDARGGLLVVDEAFMDVVPDGFGLACAVEEVGNLVVLRSFGKFYGLAGLRLGFAIASRELARRLADGLGPWAVSGPALAVGRQALDDRDWGEGMRERLEQEAKRLDGLLRGAGLEVAGGTSLFRFLRDERASEIFGRLGAAGIYVRRFDAMPDALRIGLPPDEPAWTRLAEALRVEGSQARRSAG